MTSPTLHLHHSEDLDALLDALAELLRGPLDDPFTPEVIVVPTVGVRDHVTAGLGHRLGITTNVDFLFPGNFVTRVLHSSDDDRDPWSLDSLTWSVFVVLLATEIEVPGRKAQRSLWTLARRLADLFDSYAVQRPEIIRAWADGIDSDGTSHPDGSPRLVPAAHLWQPRLWREVRALIGTASLPERLVEVLRELGDDAQTVDLPSRVVVFGVGGVSPTLLRTLVALSERTEVHVFLRHPSLLTWQSTEVALAGSLNARDSLDLGAPIAHPLLASWGRPSLEAAALLNGHRAVIDHPIGRSRDFSTSLLGRLQRDIAENRKPSTFDRDGSIRVHACHGPTRQVEVLRDALAREFVDDPTLQPHEVVVLCPDVPTFAPLVESIFGRGDLPLPIRIGDRSLVDVEPMADAMQRVLELVSGRATASEVLSVVRLTPIRSRFGWSADDVEALGEWFADLGARWGLDGAHRADWKFPSRIATGTWRDVVDQLLAGIACAAPTRRAVLGDTPVHDAVASDDLPRLGGLADFLQALLRLHDQIGHEHSVAEWMTIVHGVLDDFCGVPADDEWRRSVLHRTIDEMLDACRRGAVDPSVILISASDVRAMLDRELTGRPGTVPFRSGSITMTSLVPEAGVPARVVCLLGFDDVVQTRGGFDGDDLLGLTPCIGERHARNENRRLLLDALLSAREKVIITCTGADVTTNELVPFVVPLAELIDVLVSMTENLVGILVRHPRHGYDESALTAGRLVVGSDEAFTFDSAQLEAALARRERESGATSSTEWDLPVRAVDRLTLDHLIGALSNPTREYLRGRLDIRLADAEADFDEQIPVKLSSLSASALGAELLAVALSGGDIEEWRVAAHLHSDLPPEKLGAMLLAEIEEEVDAVLASAADWSIDFAMLDTVEFEITIGEGADKIDLSCRVDGVDETTGLVADVGFRRLKHHHRLAAAVKLASLIVWRPEIPWQSVTVGRGSKDSVFGLVAHDDAEHRLSAARRFLEMAVGIRGWADRDVVPLFDKTSHALAARSVAGAMSDWNDEFTHDAWGSLIWSGVDFDDLLAEPIRPGDPSVLSAAIPEGSPSSRIQATASWVWGAFGDAFREIDTPTTSRGVATGTDAR